MIERPLEHISSADLATLVTQRRAEGRRLDFKLKFPDAGDKAVRELLADVSSFANTDGGDILLGVGEDGNGVADDIAGVPTESLDADILRIEGQIRDCLDPRLPSFHVQPVPLENGRVVVILRVGASLLAPHRVTHKGSSRFFARNSRGKFEMDTSELRLAFAATDEMPRKLRDLHGRAITATEGLDMPCRLAADPAVVLTIAPLSILREARDIAITRETAVLPPRLSGYEFVVGLEGVIVHSPIDEDTNAVRTWAVNHRRGYIDFAWSIGRRTEDDSLIWRQYFEELPGLARASVARLRTFGMEGPWVAMATIKGAVGFRMVLGDSYPTKRAWQDPASLGEVIDDALGPESLAPFVDRFWRLFGMERPPA